MPRKKTNPKDFPKVGTKFVIGLREVKVRIFKISEGTLFCKSEGGIVLTFSIEDWNQRVDWGQFRLL